MTIATLMLILSAAFANKDDGPPSRREPDGCPIGTTRDAGRPNRFDLDRLSENDDVSCVPTGTLALAVTSAAQGQGIIAPTAGPINSSMAGASVAAPVDFGGSYWNPAILSGLPRNEFLLGSQMIIPSIHMTAACPRVDRRRVPPTIRYGVARSDSGVASNLATGVSFRLSDDSPTTFGLGVFGLVGGSVNYAGSHTTPILTPRQPPNYFGVGPIYASTTFLAIMPSASRQVTDRLAIGGGPMIVTGPASFNPAFFAPGPKDAFGISHLPVRRPTPGPSGAQGSSSACSTT